ncbi:Eco57I restriction-modification methylase domain-containing protein [bacterium]|nr:Eco57I restriction-modification methylase domain-containing protein [bacterium]
MAGDKMSAATTTDIKQAIQSRIQAFSHGILRDNAMKLFQALGYDTSREAPLLRSDYEAFYEAFATGQSKFSEEKACVSEWVSVDLLFQLSKEEVLRTISLFDTRKVDNKLIETYLFFVIELKRELYSRTELAHITREVNRLFPMPVMILFKHGSALTLSVINRRLHKRDEAKDVLEKVTLIKDIRIEQPHRAHIEILFDLSFDELQRRHSFTNFVELHNAWQQTLDTKELNKRFFQEIANWYFWTTQHVEFPKDVEKDRDIRNATSVIRLITRIMFVWFLKEKNLVPEKLFEERHVRTLLKFSDRKGSSYYKAILQNLFFATLNTEMGKRRFRSKRDEGRDGHYFIHNVFRYQSEFVNPKDTLEKYFDPIPFLNGGLFECLDKEVEYQGKLKRIRVDGFSDREDNVLKVPDQLFFNAREMEVDLNEVYGTRNKRYKVRGLIDILSSYKFTITENTPIEEEVALDPELLGKVFENLLANYNPETQATARKQTGSFYTPREIVNYMVDESLVACLTQKLAEGRGDKPKDTDESRIRQLLSYSEEDAGFSEKEKDALINAIDDLKIIDPACGSGAFPMGILHKMVHILHKIDPRNERWKQKQIEKAESIDIPETREAAVEDIEEAFENNELDYPRKLYLIENCIYGVDIQPIAAQIAKLRFFISLIVDQKVTPDKENLGVRPLPNLETKFVAANTLIALEKENANLFTNPQIEKKNEELKKTRHDYFEARTPKRKENCRQKDKKLREELATLLVDEHNLQPATAKKIANWDPYDQNASASFFEPEWMYGLNRGFDIAIGNPPYIRQEKLTDIKDLLKARYQVFNSTSDIYTYFIEQAYNVLDPNGILTFITNNSWIKSKYGTKLREFMLGKSEILQLINFEDEQNFEAAIVETSILLFRKSVPSKSTVIKFAKQIAKPEEDFVRIPQQQLSNKGFILEDSTRLLLMSRLEKRGAKLGSQRVVINRGILTGYNDAFYIDHEKRSELISKDSSAANLIKPLIRGREIKRWVVEFEDTYLINTHNGLTRENIPRVNVVRDHPSIFSHLKKYQEQLTIRRDQGDHWTNLRNCAFFKDFDKPKIVWIVLSDKPKFAYDIEGFFTNDSTFFMVGNNLKYMLAVLNSSLTEWYFSALAPTSGMGTTMWKKAYLENIPIKEADGATVTAVENLVDYIICERKSNGASAPYYFFERVVNAAVYELYLAEELKQAGITILSHVMQLPKLPDYKTKAGRGRALQVIQEQYEILRDPNHPLSVAMFKLDTVEEIRIIEGKQ